MAALCCPGTTAIRRSGRLGSSTACPNEQLASTERFLSKIKKSVSVVVFRLEGRPL